MGGGHAWLKQGSIIRQVIEEDPIGKRPLGRPRLRWEDCVKNNIKMIAPRNCWRKAAEERERKLGSGFTIVFIFLFFFIMYTKFLPEGVLQFQHYTL